MNWEDRVRAAMLAEGIDEEVANRLINGVIEDVVTDERWDAKEDVWDSQQYPNGDYYIS